MAGEFQLIDYNSAPPKPKTANKSTKEQETYNDLVTAVKESGKCGRISLTQEHIDAGETPRSVRTRISRAATRLDFKADVWTASNDPNTLFFTVANLPPKQAE